MRLAIDVSPLRLPEPTGVARAGATLLAALRARAPGRATQLLELAPEDGLAARMPLALWREVVLPARLAAAGADSLHSLVAAVPLRAPCPVVATLHELPWRLADPAARASGDRRLRHRARTALAARVAARLACVSAATRVQLLADHPDCAARALVVPNAVSPGFGPHPRGRAAARAEAPCGLAGRRFVLAVGALRMKKNGPALLEAFARTAPPEVALVLAGPEGDAGPDLRARAARSELAGRVLLPGYVDEPTLLGLYRAAEIVACPSLWEGFGLPLLEALACGTPVLAAPHAAAAEVLGAEAEGAPVLVAPGSDPASLASALGRLFTDGGLAAELSARGPAHAARFTAGRVADAVLDLHAAVVAERGR